VRGRWAGLPVPTESCSSPAPLIIRQPKEGRMIDFLIGSAIIFLITAAILTFAYGLQLAFGRQEGHE